MLEQGFYINLNWLGKFVRIIVEGVGIVGVGVIVFTLILKAITTPFDIYQRVKMRKQALIMRRMQPELEKLQKQYANDKQTYQMKMMELQKKNGYSLFGACLPMIISLVILIVAVTAFNSYANYANLSMYEHMAESYNAAVSVYAVDGKDFHLAREEDDGLTKTLADFESPFIETLEDGTTITYTLYKEDGSSINRLEVRSSSPTAYLYYSYDFDNSAYSVRRDYYVDVDKAYTNQQDAAVKAAIQQYIDEGRDEGTACAEYIKSVGAAASAEEFRTMSSPRFLWVKNVWYPDVSYRHPIQDYSTFESSFQRADIYSENWEGTRAISSVIPKDHYESMTSLLEEEKEQANGYFILIILTIGLMVLSQFIMMRSQKETNQFQTVDGQGARTQKIMMVAMPLIYAITGFLWTAAFSIYIAMSSIIGIVITLGCNLVLGRVFKKKEQEEIKQRYTRTVPWKEAENEPKKGKKN